jgi:anaerobic magnesium-protoporphyrin IX monomethyl ester cyclase
MDLKVILVNPPPYKIIEPYYDTPEYPRTSLAHLAGYLRRQAIEVGVLDCKYDRLAYDGALQRISSSKTKIIGFTSFTNEIKQAAQLAQAVKKHNPDITTIIGGVHVSALPEETIREFPEFDYGVVGEGEITLYQLIRALEEKSDIESIAGICFRKGDSEICKTSPRELISDYDSLPMPAWDLFRPAREYIIQSSRGCPFNCDFCMNPSGRAVRSRNPENVYKEIEWLVKELGAKKIVFGDENFSIDIPRAIRICELIKEAELNKRFEWDCSTHISTINSELARAMKRAGCISVGLGIESGDETILKKMGKGISFNKVFDTLSILKKEKLPYRTFFILGQPNETYETAKKTIEFAVKLNPMLPIFGIMVPYPGTKIAQLAKKGEGGYILKSRDWNDYNKEIGDAVDFQFVSRKTLEKLQFTGYIKVFLFNFRLMDLMKFIWNYRQEGMALLGKIIKTILGKAQ